MAQLFQVHPDNPQARLLKQAVAVLTPGGVLAVPTDSSYALVCHLDDKAAIVLKGIGHQFGKGGTEALASEFLWVVPEIRLVGGFDALRTLGKPAEVFREAKVRLFGV